jgi:hypothetical protein
MNQRKKPAFFLGLKINVRRLALLCTLGFVPIGTKAMHCIAKVQVIAHNNNHPPILASLNRGQLAKPTQETAD